jgi:polysaccharide export outer membrane protein
MCAAVTPAVAQTADEPPTEDATSGVESPAGDIQERVVRTSASNVGSYRLGSPDVLRVEVFDEPDLSGDFTIAADGTIMFPLLGQITISGMRISEAAHLLQQSLERDYLYDPKVSLTVVHYRSQKVEILGSVGRPGTYFLQGETRLLDLLAQAGGVVPTSAEIRRGQVARIMRSSETAGEGPTATVLIDLYELLVEGLEQANEVLADGDLVYISRTEQVHVVGEVKRPGSYPYEQGMTVLKAMSLAGGLTTKASRRGVIIRRIQDGDEVRIRAKAEDELQPQDIVEVPLGFW